MPLASRSATFGALLFVTSLLALALIQSYIPSYTSSRRSDPVAKFFYQSAAFITSSPVFPASADKADHSNMASAPTMRAIVMHAIGAPSVLKLSTVSKPVAKAGQILIRIKAFGLNRSEVFTRQGHSPGVTFPRILGIEAAGVVESAPGSSRFSEGDVVVTAMGGMGRAFDGGYAEYTVVPAGQVLKLSLSGEVDWTVLGALPELFQTAWGSIERSLQLQKGERLLVRGATSGVGLAALALAREKGAFAVGTTRNASREVLLKSVGADDVIVDRDGGIQEEVRRRYPDGFDKVLELVGVTTLDDSLKCVAEAGTLCMTGIAGGKWTYESFTPMASIPTAVKLTTYAGSSDMLLKTPIEDIYGKVKAGTMHLPIKTFKMDEIVAAHELMEFTGAEAKVVVLVD